MDRASFRHCIPIQIRFNDVDRVNHVNNAMYHTYIELGRVHYFNEVLQRLVDWDNKGFILARTEIDYKVPVVLRDDLYCFTKLEKMGGKSFTLLSIIAKKTETGFVDCAYAKGVLVCMDYKTQKSIDFPEDWRQAFTAFEAQ